jgi:hypothetical protein
MGKERPKPKALRKKTKSTRATASAAPATGTPRPSLLDGKTPEEIARMAAEDNMTVDEFVSLVRYEESDESHEKEERYRAREEAEKNEPSNKLGRLFEQSSAMVEHKEFIDRILAALSGRDAEFELKPVTIRLPKPLLDLLIWDEKKDAEAASRQPEDAATIIGRNVENQLQERLHWLTVEPTVYSRYKNLWNDFCDAHGAPELKLLEPSADEAGGSEQGPF